ncbi:N-acetyltransferase eso1 [Psilocybe cubensis]|uniref:N-acetyltransferase eso1 n=2 Tax=Psilocybe cubensis TaxID=181762 RepID=A0ACB8H1E8_PSICU|nr:N-acetyltransferase eso1 [Psilocybe cubensis]KAH9481674.1 N-acetyltransferase eso1 [Psilocybe cubensis]
MMTSNSPTKSKLVWKGKGKATEPPQDYDDLNPVITYRHLLSNNLGVRDPLRVIALCDSDAFYAACEMNRLGVDPETPLVVLQWDSLIAVNYPARKYGISRMDKKKEALKRCPHLKVVHVATYKEGEPEPGYWDDVDTNTHKVSLDYYRRESLKIAAMFKEQLPGCELEKASIDEAFIDFTKPVREIMLQRYPHLAQVPPEGADTPLPPPPPIMWEGLGNLIPVNPSPTVDQKPGDGQPVAHESAESAQNGIEPEQKQVEVTENKEHQSTDPRGKDVEEPPHTWHDVALSIAAELMGKAREEVRVKLGYSTSAGIARNKFLAKLTASYKKLNNQSILRNSAIPKYLRPMQFQKIRFLGGKLGDALAKEYDVSTVGDLLTISLDEMQDKFGESSLWIYEVLRGIDRTEVKDKGSTLNKSMLASKNLPKPITKASEGQHWIRVLAAELALRLNDARKISPNLWPKTLVLHARKGYEAGRSKQSPFPFHREVTVDVIAAAGDKLWKELVGNSSNLKVSSVQLAFTGIDVAEGGQRSIEGFLKPISSTKKRPRDSAAITDVQDEEELPQPARLSASDVDNLNDESPHVPSASYTCVRCGKAFQVTGANQSSSIDEQMSRLKMEHDDFHFAQDLADESTPRSVITVTEKKTEKKPSSSNKKRKTAAGPSGIEKFFRK